MMTTKDKWNSGKCRGGWILVSLIFMHVAAMAVALAQPPLTAKGLLESVYLKNRRQTLQNGEIVLVSRLPDVADSELNVTLAVLIPASLGDTLAELQRQFSDKQSPDIKEVQEIRGLPATLQQAIAFERVAFDPSEGPEADALLQVKPGKDYNLSAMEIALFRRAAEEMNVGADSRKAAAAAMKNVLYRRYLSYRQYGLQGIPEYQTGPAKLVSPASELMAATKALALIISRFPDYYRSLRFYPEEGALDIVHQFFWVKRIEDSRPRFELKHRILDIQPDYGLITERRFYISHSLNSLQVVIACLPYEGHTLVVLLNRVFTEQVNVTIGRGFAKKIGRSIVEKMMWSVFEDLHAAFALSKEG